MNRRPIIIVVGAIGLIVLASVAWYLGSPLFINRAVDEAFPFEAPSQDEVAQLPEVERESLEEAFLAAVPDENEMADLSEEQRSEVAEQVATAAAVVMSDKTMVDPMPPAADEWLVVANGQITGADSFHMGSGTATILQQGENRVLRLEDFSVTNGPDLHLILTRHPAPSSRADVGDDYIDLGSLKGNLGNQNYEIPAGVDLSQYPGVVVYCVPFHVVFATATLG